MKTLKRDAPQYIEIENFKDYELTPCVAYEMAIRNQAFNQSVQATKEFFKNREEAIECFFNRTAPGETDCCKGKNTKSREDCEEDVDTAGIYIMDHLEKTMLFNKKHGVVLHAAIKSYDKTFYEILKKISIYLHRSKQKYNLSPNTKHSPRVEYRGRGIARIHKEIKRGGFKIRNFIDTQASWVDYYMAKTPNGLSSWGQNIAHWQLFEANNIIEPNFSRPILYGDQLKSRRVSLELNLSLPLDELVAYLKHVKQDIDKTPYIAAAPIELLGEKLQAADYEVCKSDGKCFDIRHHLSKQQKLADMFFIYDALKAGWKKSDILKDLLHRKIDITNDVSGSKEMDRKTLDRYYQIALEYIDSEKYKELITGTSTKK